MNKPLAHTPPMGWNSWNTFSWNINAVGMFNFGDKTSEMSLQFYDIGLPSASGRGLEMYDCYKHETIGTYTERIAVEIPSHDCMMFRAKVVKV